MDLKNMTPEHKDFLLNTYDISEDDLRELAKDKSWKIRKRVAKNPNTPVKVLRKLAKDETWIIRGTIAISPNTPVDLLRELTKDKDPGVRAYIAYNPNTPKEVLQILKEDSHDIVRWEVAQNPNTSIPILLGALTYEKSLKYPDSDVINSLYDNPKMPSFAKSIIETLFEV